MSEGDAELPRIGTQLAWDRMPRETDEAWQAFVEYRAMGLSRNAQRVADILGKSLSHIQKYSSRWEWRRRIGLYEQHLDAHRQEEHEKAIRDMARKHITASAFLLHKAMSVLKNTPDSNVSVRDAIAMFRAAVPAERQGRAAEQAFLPNQGAGLLGDIEDIDDFSDDELGEAG